MSFKSVPKITEWIVCREKKTGKIVSVRKSLFKSLRYDLYTPEATKVVAPEATTETVLESTVELSQAEADEFAQLTSERAWLSKDAAKKARYYELKTK